MSDCTPCPMRPMLKSRAPRAGRLVHAKHSVVRPLALLGTLIALISAACSEKKPLPAIGENIARPVSVVFDKPSSLFYVLNSNNNHRYEGGSILSVKRDGTRGKTLAVPRLGRNLAKAGNFLLATFDRESAKGSLSQVALYRIERGASNAGELSEVKRWEFDECSPANAVMAEKAGEAYPYFAVTCLTGRLLVGKLDTDQPELSSLQSVRLYPGFVRRALQLDTERNLLYSFVTDMGKPNLFDSVLADSKAWTIAADGKGALVEGANDVPDELEKDNATYRRLRERGHRFQFVVYDLTSEDAAGFPSRENRDVFETEYRWLYFEVTDDPELTTGLRYYRTNFWKAEPHPTDANIFFLSHRGLGKVNKSEHANNIIEVSVKGTREEVLDMRKPTGEVFEFKKVFGFKDSQRNSDAYLADFVIATPQTQSTLVVNSFRDLVYFDRERYALTASTLASSPGEWTTTEASNEPSKSYFQIAASSPDPDDQAVHLATCSFYGDAIIIFKLVWGDDLQEIARLP